MARKISLINRVLGDGRYEVRELFGKGSFAEVYRAGQINLQRDVALKILNEHASADAELVKRFHREAETIARFDHPHIIKIFDHGQEDDLHYYVMNFLPRTLRSQLHPGRPLPVEVLLQIARQLAAALAYAQNTVKNFVHRDLKPENVMLDHSHHAILSDFGLVRGEQITQLTQGNLVMGTPIYMAPEQIRGLAVDGRADLYALGVLLYECATGTPPFKGEIMAVCHQHVNEAPRAPRQLNPELPEEIAALLLKLLEKEPQRRFQDAAEFVAALEALPLHLRQPLVNIYSQPTLPLPREREAASLGPPQENVISSQAAGRNSEKEVATVAAPQRRSSMLPVYAFVGVTALTFALALGYYFSKGEPSSSALQQPAQKISPPSPVRAATQARNPYGVLEVATQPSGAAIRLNGNWQRQASPARFDSLAPGTYHVQVEAEGYQDWTTTLLIDSAQVQHISAQLQQLHPASSPQRSPTPALAVEVPLLITSEPPSVISVDGVPQSQLAEARIQVPARPGAHRVGFQLESYAPVTREVIVEAKAENRLDFKWFGRIRVQAFDESDDPVFGAVFLDSMGTTHLSDGTEWQVPVGEYEVIVKKTGFVMRDAPPKIIVRGGDRPHVPPIVLQKRQ